MGNYKLLLNVSKNKISNVRVINKYFINAEGVVPVQSIDIKDNMFKREHLTMLVKAYL